MWRGTPLGEGSQGPGRSVRWEVVLGLQVICFSLGSDEKGGRELLNESALSAQQQEEEGEEEKEEEKEEGEEEEEEEMVEDDVGEEQGADIKESVATAVDEPPGMHIFSSYTSCMVRLCLCAL